MKNIKVNIINNDGNPSSTTLNYAICITYYDVFRSTEDKIQDLSNNSDNLRPHISLFVQDFVNFFIKEQSKKGYIGCNQYSIERGIIKSLLLHPNPSTHEFL